MAANSESSGETAGKAQKIDIRTAGCRCACIIWHGSRAIGNALLMCLCMCWPCKRDMITACHGVNGGEGWVCRGGHGMGMSVYQCAVQGVGVHASYGMMVVR